MIKEVDAELAKQLQDFIKKLDDLKSFKLGPFEIILDDPSGDSFIENPFEPKRDPNMVITFYKRTREQNEAIGLDVSRNRIIFKFIFLIFPGI